jgi:two-component system, chemotaxis family, sensor kinase CheA
MSDPSLIADFADEAREHLEEVEGALLRLENDPTNRDLLNTIFRSMHTIKGASEYLGLARIAALSHNLESLLDLFREGQLTADKVAVDILIDARDRIEALIGEVETSGAESTAIDDLLDRAAALSSGDTQDGEGGLEAASADDTDAELFDIFSEQLVEGVTDLLAAASDDVTGLDDRVARLSASANYMGYDGLVAIYDDLAASLSTQADPVAAVATAVARMHQLFPQIAGLTELEARNRTEAAPDTQTETDRSASVSPAEDIADALAALPTIDENRRTELLAKSLDDVFSSMQANNRNHMDQPVDDAAFVDLDVLTPMPDQGDTTVADTVNDTEDGAVSLGGDVDPDHATGTGSAPDHSRSDQDDTPGVDLWLEAASVLRPDSDEPTAVPDKAETTITTDASDAMDATVALPDFDAPPPAPTKPDPAPQETFAARSNVRRSIRVEAQKIDDLMNQVGELVVNRSAFAQLFTDMRTIISDFNQRFAMEKTDQRVLFDLTSRLNEATTVLGRVTGELQEQVMKVRMLPISRLFNRYPRLVHDLLKNSDKKIQLQFRGEETELDRMVIEQLADPMIHIIRNAVDHGIEHRDERTRKGKPESGVLLLEAYHEGSNVVIEVIDDGKGIDLSRIREKAIEKNLADREDLERMDQRQLVDLIMLPGFSTTDEVTLTSGRGVGMDVVKQSLEKINGSLTIDTRQDVGTRIRIKIPLTLAIIPALMVRCAGGHFTVPLSTVQETLRIDQGEIFSVDGSEVIEHNDEPLPLVNLGDLLNMSSHERSRSSGRRFVVIVSAIAGRTGFVVDELLGRQEVVIKPLEDYLQENSGFSGATILGNGGISLILNVDELVVMAKEREVERRLAAALL